MKRPANRYVSFPTQTLFKSSKVIPVMLVGKFVHGKSYPWIECVPLFFFVCFFSSFSLLELSVDADARGRR